MEGGRRLRRSGPSSRPVHRGSTQGVVDQRVALSGRGAACHTVLSAPEQRRVLELVEGRSRDSAQQVLGLVPQALAGGNRDGGRRHVLAVPQSRRRFSCPTHRSWPTSSTSSAPSTPPLRESGSDTAAKSRSSAGTGASPVNTTPGSTPGCGGPAGCSCGDGTASPHLNGPPSTSSWPVNCEVGAAWRLKEAFADIYDSADRAEAGRRFDDWMRRVEGSGLLRARGHSPRRRLGSRSSTTSTTARQTPSLKPSPTRSKS